MLLTVLKISLVLLITFYLYLFLPAGQHSNEVPTAMEKLDGNFVEPKSLKREDASEEILPLLMWNLTPALVEKARTELNETEEVKQKALVELRQMVEAEENLISPTDDVFLLAFLRKYKFDVSKAFRRLQDFWRFSSIDYEDLFANVDRERLLSLLQKNLHGLLKYRDQKGSAVIIAKIGMLDPEEESPDDVFIALSGIWRWAMEHEATQIAGCRVIYDVRGFGWKHLKYVTPSRLILSIREGWHTMPVTYRKVHVVGEPGITRLLSNIAYPFLPEEAKKVLSFHSQDLEFLKDVIHPSVLPEEYGGLAPHFETSVDFIKEYLDRALAIQDYGYYKNQTTEK